MSPAATPTGATATRRALLVLAAAFTTSALLFVVLTVAFRLVPYDSPSLQAALHAITVVFFASYGALFVAFLVIARAEPSLRGFVVPGALLAGFDALASLSGEATRIAGHGERTLRATSDAMDAAEPVVSLAVALLAMLALSALSARRERVLAMAIAASVGIGLVFCVVPFFGEGPRSLASAWFAWALAVARPLLVAVLALRVAGTMKRASATPAGGTAPEGPYRAAGEGAPLPPRVDVPDAATATSLRGAAVGLGLYRIGFLVHVASSVVTTFIAVTLLFFVRGDETFLAFLVVPLASLVTSAVMMVGMGKLRALPRAAGTRGMVMGALATTLVVALVDMGCVVLGMLAIVASSSSSHRMKRQLGEIFVLEWPLAALLGGVALLLLVTAFARIGEKVSEPRVVTRARWVQGLVVASGACQMGCVRAIYIMQATRFDDSRSAAGLVVVCGLGLAAFAATVAALVLHVLLVGATQRALFARAAHAVPAHATG